MEMKKKSSILEVILIVKFSISTCCFQHLVFISLLQTNFVFHNSQDNLTFVSKVLAQHSTTLLTWFYDNDFSVLSLALLINSFTLHIVKSLGFPLFERHYKPSSHSAIAWYILFSMKHFDFPKVELLDLQAFAQLKYEHFFLTPIYH